MIVKARVNFGKKPPTGRMPVKPGQVCRAARLLALAHHVERLIEAGELRDYSEAARMLGVTRGRLTQVMNLLGLSPLIQEGILTGKIAVSESRLRVVVREVVWGVQEWLVAG